MCGFQYDATAHLKKNPKKRLFFGGGGVSGGDAALWGSITVIAIKKHSSGALLKKK